MAYLLSLIVNGVTILQNDTHGTNIYADKHIKNNSNDNYILLGGGGHIDKGTFALVNHGVHWEGFTKIATSSETWGTLISSNGYTPLFWLESTSGGGVAFSDKGGQTFMQIDGEYYANEGRHLVLNTGNYSTTLDGRYYTETEVNNLLANYSLSTHDHDYSGRYVTLNTNQTISGVKTFNSSCLQLKGIEQDNITHKNDYLMLWKPDNSAAYADNSSYVLTNSLSFNWHNDEWRVGQIRGGNTSTLGFVIALIDDTDSHPIDRFRISREGNGYLNGNLIITDAALESDLSKYLPLTGGTLTGNLTCNGSYIFMNGGSGAKGYRGYFNNSQSADRAAGSHIFQANGWAYGENATSIGLNAYAGIRNTDSDSATYPYLHWQWMDCLQVQETTSGTAVNCYGAILTNAGGKNDTATFSLCINDMCVAYGMAGNSEALNNFLSFTNIDANCGRVVVYIADNKSGNTNERIFGGTTSHPRYRGNVKIGNLILGSGCYITKVASMSVNGVTVYRIAFYFWNKTLSSNYDITKKTTAMVCTKVNNTNYSSASSYASGFSSVASGAYSVASGNYSIADGYSSVASGIYSVASGSYSVASGISSIASGSYSVASGISSIASGGYSVASGSYSNASGSYSVASNYYSVASGGYSVASGFHSVASGYHSIASGGYSAASGYYSVASSNNSVAIGNSSVASGFHSVAIGSSSVASGSHSVASGYHSVASGYYSIASGSNSVAKHEGSKVYAMRGVSGLNYQTVLGRDNVETSTASVVVGWGTSDTARKNIFVLDTDGNATFGDGGVGTVTAATFNGALNGNVNGNAKTANALSSNDNISDANTVSFTDLAIRWYGAVPSTTPNLPTSTYWQNGLLALPLHSNGSTAQLYFSATKKPYFRSTQTSDWNEIAYVTDNVASATKLQTARTIWGKSFDGTANVEGDFLLFNASGGNWAKAIYVMGFGTRLSEIGCCGSGDTLKYTYIGPSSDSPFFAVAPTGNILIGTTWDNGDTRVQVNGNGRFEGSLTTPSYVSAAAYYENSDIRLKKDIKSICSSINIPTIKEFKWKQTDHKSYGLIAQDLEAMGYPELVDVKDDGYKSVNYTAAHSLIIGKLQLKIKELEDRIKYLESK